jgi:hypothetical protein
MKLAVKSGAIIAELLMLTNLAWRLLYPCVMGIGGRGHDWTRGSLAIALRGSKRPRSVCVRQNSMKSLTPDEGPM